MRKIVIAIILKDERVLLCKRPADVHKGGLWEFPGGKVDAGETVEQALLREVKEELGIEVTGYEPFIEYDYTYPEKELQFHCFLVKDFQGKPQMQENQLGIQWASFSELADLQFPEANHSLLQLINQQCANS